MPKKITTIFWMYTKMICDQCYSIKYTNAKQSKCMAIAHHMKNKMSWYLYIYKIKHKKSTHSKSELNKEKNQQQRVKMGTKRDNGVENVLVFVTCYVQYTIHTDLVWYKYAIPFVCKSFTTNEVWTNDQTKWL